MRAHLFPPVIQLDERIPGMGGTLGTKFCCFIIDRSNIKAMQSALLFIWHPTKIRMPENLMVAVLSLNEIETNSIVTMKKN